MNIDELLFDEKGLIPAIIQDASTKDVLTLAYMNKESLKKTLDSGETWFFSRSRQELWHKGATSGNTQSVVEIKYDCDQDALVVRVSPNGPACHNGTSSCFIENMYQNQDKNLTESTNYQILANLENLIADREINRPEGAYTTYLFEKGVDKILKKVGEESAEVIIAAKNRDTEELKWEAADLVYHLFVLLREQKLPFKEILNVLETRHQEKDTN